MPILSSRRHASALLVYISCIRQVDLTHQVDFECPHVCNACIWHSPYLLHMASTIIALLVVRPLALSCWLPQS